LKPGQVPDWDWISMLKQGQVSDWNWIPMLKPGQVAHCPVLTWSLVNYNADAVFGDLLSALKDSNCKQMETAIPDGTASNLPLNLNVLV
jgi:hypothetical protein